MRKYKFKVGQRVRSRSGYHGVVIARYHPSGNKDFCNYVVTFNEYHDHSRLHDALISTFSIAEPLLAAVDIT